jgi:hypothetical protein
MGNNGWLPGALIITFAQKGKLDHLGDIPVGQIGAATTIIGMGVNDIRAPRKITY